MSTTKQATKVAVKPTVKVAVKAATKVAVKPTVKVAVKPTVKVAVKAATKVADPKPAAKAAKPLLYPSDFVVAEFNISENKRKALTEHLRDVHSVQSFLAGAKLSEVRELLCVEVGGKARGDMLHRIIGRLSVLTNAFFKAKLKLAAPKLTKVKKPTEDLI
jgi:hypothetical protein